jgi:hypothetical protein
MNAGWSLYPAARALYEPTRPRRWWYASRLPFNNPPLFCLQAVPARVCCVTAVRTGTTPQVHLHTSKETASETWALRLIGAAGPHWLLSQEPLLARRFSLLSPGSFLSLQALGNTEGGGAGGGGDTMGPEQQHQVFLSRLLLMLGSFVIMCLLLF